jgi:hypothetical protein
MIWIAIIFGLSILLTYGAAYFFAKTDKNRITYFAAVVDKKTGVIIKKIDITGLPVTEMLSRLIELRSNLKEGEDARIISERR